MGVLPRVKTITFQCIYVDVLQQSISGFSNGFDQNEKLLVRGVLLALTSPRLDALISMENYILEGYMYIHISVNLGEGVLNFSQIFNGKKICLIF